MGVVILSRHFIEKEWPQAELDALVTRELEGQTGLLPVWHGITATELSRKSPLLASRLAIDTDRGLDAVCAAILRAMGRDVRPAAGGTPAKKDFLAMWGSLGRDDRGEWDASVARSRLEAALADPRAFSRERIGDYVLGEFLGSGGAGAVFRATHHSVGRTVALKLFYPVDASLEYLTAATHRAVRGPGTLRHPNIAAVHDFGSLQLSGRTMTYLALDLVRGKTLTD